MIRSKDYSIFILRIAIGVVLLWFGFNQLINPSNWTRMIPSYVSFVSLSPEILIYINGVAEIILAILLILGLFTRVSSLLITIHLFHIVTIVGYGPTGVRDLGLALAALAIFFYGPDNLCLEKIKKEEKN